MKPLVEIGFMPEDLSVKPQPYKHKWKPGAPYEDIYTGWAYPPKDYEKWGELCYQWAKHCVGRYGMEEVEKWYWQTWNEANAGYWQGTDEEFYDLTVAGISDSQQNFLQPSVFVPYVTWDRIKPGAGPTADTAEYILNVAAVQLDDPTELALMGQRLEGSVKKVEVADLKTAYEATPGYAEQQSTLNTIRIFTLLIGVLVLGGFFQIQTLQKVAQIGMLKAIGASTLTIAVAFILQIVYTTILGVGIGVVGTYMLSLSLPPTVPITFTPESALVAIVSLMIIGPMAGLISLVVLLRVEPLTALGLAS
jgi:putative ABC transport system permease protein